MIKSIGCQQSHGTTIIRNADSSPSSVWIDKKLIVSLYLQNFWCSDAIYAILCTPCSRRQGLLPLLQRSSFCEELFGTSQLKDGGHGWHSQLMALVFFPDFFWGFCRFPSPFFYHSADCDYDSAQQISRHILIEAAEGRLWIIMNRV